MMLREVVDQEEDDFELYDMSDAESSSWSSHESDTLSDFGGGGGGGGGGECSSAASLHSTKHAGDPRIARLFRGRSDKDATNMLMNDDDDDEKEGPGVSSPENRIAKSLSFSRMEGSKLQVARLGHKSHSFSHAVPSSPATRPPSRRPPSPRWSTTCCHVD